jgi:hypothetical protein
MLTTSPVLDTTPDFKHNEVTLSVYTGTGMLKEKLPGMQSAISSASTCEADVKLEEFGTLNFLDTNICINGCVLVGLIPFGTRYLFSLSTPGHTAVPCT